MIDLENLTVLSFSKNPEHASSACRAYSLHCFSAIFHGYFSTIFDLFFRFALYTITFHNGINLSVVNNISSRI